MDTAIATRGETAAAPHLRLGAESLRRATLWLMVFGGSITMVEPGPYELFGILTIVVWSFGGIRLQRELVPIFLLVLIYMCGAMIALTQVLDRPNVAMWTSIGWYLAMTGLFFASVLAQHTSARLALIVRAYVATAVMCSVIGTLGYMRVLPGFEDLLLYHRVKSTFGDPNVFGPFLVLPALVLIQGLYIRGVRGSAWTVISLILIMTGIFLSFSRGAWGHLAASTALMTIATFWCTRSQSMRMRILLLCGLGGFAISLFVAFLLSFDSVSNLFAERASLEQSYDLGQFGRFNRHWLGFVLALSKPMGIGMLQFAPIFGEDTHNAYLNAFMSYGWIGGVAWPTIVVLTLVVGWRYSLTVSPWRPIFICSISTYTIVICEAWIIDIDHWRHVWLLFGVVWGLVVATARLEQSRRACPG